MFYMFIFCVFKCFFLLTSNLYLYNAALSVLFCVNKDCIIIILHNILHIYIYIYNYTVCILFYMYYFCSFLCCHILYESCVIIFLLPLLNFVLTGFTQVVLLSGQNDWNLINISVVLYGPNG